MARRRPPASLSHVPNVGKARPPDLSHLGRTARLLHASAPIALGGHSFTVAAYTLTCTRCHVTLPRWAMTEGLGWHFGLARWCPDLPKALPCGDPSPT